jgi:large subunit ribosomal protein L32
MVIRMRVNRSKSGKRRSHHALSATRLIKCECGALRQNHRACAACGKYDGRIVVDVVSRAERDSKRMKRREKAMRAAGLVTEATAAAGD